MKDRELPVIDTPRHIEGQDTSSIGGTWPPEHTSWHRIKAVYPVPIRNLGLIDQLAHYFDQSLFQLDYDNSHSSITRVQFRAVFEQQVLQNALDHPLVANYLESAIRLSPGHLGQQPILVYISANSPSRFSHPQDLLVTQENILKTTHISTRNPKQIRERIPSHYQVRILDNSYSTTIDQIHALYQRFGWSKKDVTEMIENPLNTFCVAYAAKQIVSCAIAERALIPLRNTDLRVCEITEAATDSNHEKQGLYNALSATLIEHIAIQSKNKDFLGGEVDLVFGECNTDSQGVLIVAKSQGREFATTTCNHLGLTDRGVLMQQVPINGGTKYSNYNNLLPAYFNRQSLYQHFLP